MMAAIQSMRFIPFVPLSNPSLHNRNTLRSTTTGQLIPSLTSSQKTRRPAAVLSCSGGSSGAQRNAVARAEGWRHAFGNIGDESDDDLPSLEDLLRLPPCPTILDKASRTEPASQHLDQLALNGVAIQADRTKSGIGERLGGSLDQPMILDDDEPEEESTEDEADISAGDIETGHTKLDASSQSTLQTSERASRPKSTDVSGPWYDIEEERYVDWLAPKFGPRTPRDVSCSPAPDQTKTLLALSIPPQDQIDEQRVCDITPSLFEEFGAHSSSHNPNDSNNGWTEDQEAELENELTLALVEQGNPLSTSAPSSPRPRLADAPQDNAMTQECTKTTSSRPERQREASRLGTPAQGLEEWKQQENQAAGETLVCQEPRKDELVVDRGAVERQQHEEVRESSTHLSSHAQSKINLRHPATPINNGHRHTLSRSASPSDPSSRALCEKTGLQNPGEKRGRRDTHREIGNESLGSDDSDDAYDKGDDDLRPAKRRKLYEAPALIASPRFRFEMGDTQSQADDGCPSTSVDNEQHHTLHTSWNSSMARKRRLPKEDEELDELAMDDYSQQEYDTDGSDNSADEDYAHDVGDEDEEDTQPTKQRKSPLHSRGKALGYRHSPTSTPNEQLHTPPPSQSPSATEKSKSAAEYREWSFGGSFKSVRIGTKTTFHLAFTLDDTGDIPEQLELSAAFKAIDKRLSLKSPTNTRASQSTMMPTKDQHRTSRSPKKRNPWTVEEDATLKKMRDEDDCSWKEISTALPLHPQGSIEVRYSKNFSSGTRSKKGQRL